VVGLHDRTQLRLGRLLRLEQPIPIAGERPELGKERRRNRQSPPVLMFVAEGVGEDERV